MKVYVLKREQLIHTSIENAWNFFSSPENLQELTPTNMGFEIISPQPLPAMHEGQLIEYKVRPVLNIPLYWKTEIKEVSENYAFKDIQLKGPYTQWIHTHSFVETENGVLMKDVVEYALPLGFIGRLVHSLYVKKKLEDIFDFRYGVVEKLFPRTN